MVVVVGEVTSEYDRDKENEFVRDRGRKKREMKGAWSPSSYKT